jgi:DNA-binding sugar fermentation-stimulating protein
VYARKLKSAIGRGVEVLVYGTKIDEKSISLSRKIPLALI